MQSWKVEDPIMQYLATMSSTERDKRVFSVASAEVVAAKGMENLRVIPALINGVREEEAVLDSGSQIVSMSRTAASECKLSWDPQLSINMMTANGQVSRTCGVARNVPFTMGNITVHLQVHVLEGAAYRVLLGRPFDVITESKIVNSQEGLQYINVTDPSTKEQATLLTYPRGHLPRAVDVKF